MSVSSILNCKIVDHTHTLSSDAPGYLPVDRMTMAPQSDYERDGYADFCLTLGEHCGTHIDAPFHVGGPGQDTVDLIKPENLVVPATIVDVRQQVLENDCYELAIADLSQWENRHGQIPTNSIVVMFSGWQARWLNPNAYKNKRDQQFQFPGFSEKAILWLLEQREISGIGIDALSIDPGPSTDFPVHMHLGRTNKWALENLCNLDLVPPVGCVFVVGPMKHQGGSGGPARVFSLSPDAAQSAL